MVSMRVCKYLRTVISEVVERDLWNLCDGVSVEEEELDLEILLSIEDMTGSSHAYFDVILLEQQRFLTKTRLS